MTNRDGAPKRSVAIDTSRRHTHRRLVLGVRIEDAIPQRLLRRDVGHRPQEREAPALTVHGVLPGRKRDVASGAAAALPDAKADQLQAGEGRIAREVHFGVRELPRRRSAIVRGDRDRDVRVVVGLHRLPPW